MFVGALVMLGSSFMRPLPGFGSSASAVTLINGRAFIDINADGVQSANADPLYNEVGIPNVTVTVTSSSGASVATTTNGIGDWVINTDLPGPFRVQYTGLPAKLSDGSNRGGSLQFNNGGLANFGAFGKVDNLGTIVEITDVDLVGIGNRVWDDFNANGVQDAGEPGIPNVVITISSPEGPLRTVGGCNGTNGDGVATTVTTDAQGLYQFVCLDAGKSFTLSIDKSQYAIGGPLEAYKATVSSAGGDVTLDSNGVDGGAAVIASGVTKVGFDMTYDFGFVKSGDTTTTTIIAATTTTTLWDSTTTVPAVTTTTICESTTTTAPETTTTTIPETTTTTIPVTTTTEEHWSTTTTVPITTTTVPATTTTVPATTTTVPATTTTKEAYGSTTTTAPTTSTTVPATTTTVVATTTTTTVPLATTTTAPATTTTVPATTTTSTTIPATTTTVPAPTYVFVPVPTVPATTTTIPPTTSTATPSTTTTTTTTTTSVKPVNVLGNEITLLPVPGETPAFTGSDVTYRGFQGAGLLLMGLGLAGLLSSRKKKFNN